MEQKQPPKARAAAEPPRRYQAFQSRMIDGAPRYPQVCGAGFQLQHAVQLLSPPCPVFAFYVPPGSDFPVPPPPLPTKCFFL